MNANKFSLIGIPWDMGSSLGRPGSRYAPKEVREQLQWILQRIKNDKIYDVEKNNLLNLSSLEYNDLGDINLKYHDIEGSLEMIKNKADEVFANNSNLIAIGGDHSVSYPLIGALSEYSSGNIGLIQFDAHLDLLDENDKQGKYSQSSEIYRALELENLSANNLVQIGVRGFNYPEAHELVNKEGITQFTPQQIRDEGPELIAKKTLEKVQDRTEHIFLTFDIDVLDPAYAPGTGADDPNGLNPNECFKLLELFAPAVSALDIVEINPVFDQHGMTAAIGAKVLFNYMVYHLIGNK